MAKTKEVKTEKAAKTVDFSKLDLKEARVELEKLNMAIITGKEKNTSKKTLLRKHIARLLTKVNLEK